MNILLVDDDSYVLDALRKTLDWEALGIENVYTAPSVNRARKIIEDIPIQILICDIEMPKENGFELLKWIREKKYIIKEILLTSYAEFKYATEAIKFGCYAYALKPIDYNQLEQLILGAVQEEKKALSFINHEKYFEYWTASIKIRREQFFTDLLINHQMPELTNYDLSYQKDQRFQPIMIRFFAEWGNTDGDNARGMFEWTLHNLITEAFTSDQIKVEAVIKLKREEFLVLTLVEDNPDVVGSIHQLSEMFLKKAEKNLGITCSVTAGSVTGLEQLQKEVAEFFSFMDRKLIEYGEITVLNNYRIRAAEYETPDFTLWKNFLKSGQYESVKKEVTKYLERQKARNNLDKEALKKFVTGVIHLLITVMNENNILTYKMGETLFNTDLINASTQNVSSAVNGIGQMLDTVRNMKNSPEVDQSIVQTVKAFIDNNLDKELTREALAEQVYLNQDYLARIFKKEIGESIVNYITGKRIAVAREYLEKTNESVNSVAIKVGYDNFSYFTKLFKERVGMTPKEYRSTYGLINENAAIWQRNGE